MVSSKPHTLTFSLLTQKSLYSANAVTPIDEQTFIDLGIKRILEPMILNKKRESVITGPAQLICQEKAIIEYRLDVLDDLLENEALSSCIQKCMPAIQQLQFYIIHPGRSDEATPLQETVWRIRELENYVVCIEAFASVFAKDNLTLQSEGMKQFKEIIMETENDPGFKQLKETLPEFLKKIYNLKSVTLGVNLNMGLIPCEAVLLSVNDSTYEKSGFLEKVASTDGKTSIGKLHSVKGTVYEEDPLFVPLFKDLSKALNKSVSPLQRALKNFGQINGMLFVKLMDEFMFYLGAVQLIKQMRELGLPMSKPIICDKNEQIINLKGFYNIDLALQDGKNVVVNDFMASKNERLFILTGPNSGGKTVYLQGIGLVQYLAQIGLYVPAVYAELSIFDNIYTHYPNLESPEKGAGRLGEEAARLKTMVAKAQQNSLILLNESFSSTSMGEALYLAQDLLNVLDYLGATALFVTHLHQLAIDRGQILEGKSAHSAIVSLVAQVKKDKEGNINPSYHVLPGPPEGRSYAREMARHHGISREQLMKSIAVC